MTMSDEIAIQLTNVSKVYKLFDSPIEQLLNILKLSRKKCYREHHALRNISLDIKKGERLGIVGRNGAGKTTLLKLITQNFQPTSGEVNVNGKVQALMDMGLGFHPEFTGLENIKASLIYNGLTKKELDYAVDDIIEFVELDDFLNQPLRTYSLGMKSRLYFAAATAIKPEILIIDEVLGAGDAYFSAKSADRMKKLTNSGCTLLLVSHATSQIIQFCKHALWIECGEVVQRGDALEIIKSYEQYTKKLEVEAVKNISQSDRSTVIHSKWLRDKLLNEVLTLHDNTGDGMKSSENNFSKSVSRWPSHVDGLKISNISVKNCDGIITSTVSTGESISIEMEMTAYAKDTFDCYFVILLFTEAGQWVSRHCSNKFELSLEKGEKRTISLSYDELYIGNGKYYFSAAIYQTLDLYDLSSARYYDLLSRSFEINIKGRYPDDNSLIDHPAKWVLDHQEDKISVTNTDLSNIELT